MRPRPEAPIPQSILARTRLRAIIFVLAPLVLVGTMGAAWIFNTEVQGHNLLRDSVKKMAGAPSYTAIGTDSLSGGANQQEIRERFDYIAPDQASSRYITSSRQPGPAFQPVLGACVDTSLVIQGSTRYRKCNDASVPSPAWVQESQDPGSFSSLAFQPWRRISWCSDFDLQDTQVLGGVKTQIYTCSVPLQKEAAEHGTRVPSVDSGAHVDITVWVREGDGYLGRFAMDKAWPATTGTVTEKLDYVYANFGNVSPIQVPNLGPASTGSAGPPTAAPMTNNGAPSLGNGTGAVVTPAPPSGAVASINPRSATIGSHGFYLEIARDDYSIGKGLSNRPALPADTAMLFILPREERWSFWMKDTLIPLDVLYLGRDLRVVDIFEMLPEPGVPQERLKQYQSRVAAQYAIEIKGGLARQYGFQIGDKVGLN